VLHISILGYLELCLGSKPTKAPRGERTGLDDLLVAEDVFITLVACSVDDISH